MNDVGCSRDDPPAPAGAVRQHASAKERVIGAYPHPLIRTYCTLRFVIMNMQILEQIGQYIPRQGRVLDVGCGFGLFSLYYALQEATRRITSIDIDDKRIGMAHAAALSLGLREQTCFEVQSAEALSVESGSYDAAYMLDLIHHVSRAGHAGLIQSIYDALCPGGILILKDVETRPWWKVLFTWALDMIMSPQHPPHYVEPDSMRRLLEETGFDVKIHPVHDVLPYPHILYVCRKGTVVT